MTHRFVRGGQALACANIEFPAVERAYDLTAIEPAPVQRPRGVRAPGIDRFDIPFEKKKCDRMTCDVHSDTLAFFQIGKTATGMPVSRFRVIG